MYILIVEDDKLQFEAIEKALIEDQINRCDRIERIKTESEFREKFETIAADSPDVIILDMMIRWASRSKWVEPPKEIAEAGFYLAGVRCERMLATDARTENIPIIFYTTLDNDESRNFLPERSQINYLDKDFRAEKIWKLIRRIVP